MASGVGAVHLQRILKKLPATIAVINVAEAGTFTAEGSLKFITEPKDRVRVANAIAQVRSLARAVRSEAGRYTGYAGFAGATPASAEHVKEQGADAISVCLAAILTTRDMFLHRWRASPSARNFVTVKCMPVCIWLVQAASKARSFETGLHLCERMMRDLLYLGPGGGNSSIFYVHPYLEHDGIFTIFQMGWFNHQLETSCFSYPFLPVIQPASGILSPASTGWFFSLCTWGCTAASKHMAAYAGVGLQNGTHRIHLCCIDLHLVHRENAGTVGWYPSCLSPPRSPFE